MMNLSDELKTGLSTSNSNSSSITNSTKMPKKIIKLDKTSVVLNSPSHQFTTNTTTTTTNSPANNITNTIFGLNSHNTTNHSSHQNSNNGSQKPILVFKKISQLTPGLDSKSSRSTPSPIVKKPKIKNSGHIKSLLLSQSDQQASSHHHHHHKHHTSLLNENSFAFSITKKAPPIKILKQQATQLIPVIVNEPSTLPHFVLTPQVGSLAELAPDNIELSVQEVTVESTTTTSESDMPYNFVESEVVVKSQILTETIDIKTQDTTETSKSILKLTPNTVISLIFLKITNKFL